MIKSILVAVDSSAHAGAAREHAVELAKAYQARVTGLYVLDVRFLEMPPYLDYSYAFEAVPPALMPLEVLESFRAKSNRILGEFMEAVGHEGVEVETRTEEGVPSQVIAEVGDAYDLLVMGKRGEHARWGRELLGSTAEMVVRRAGTPVLLTEEMSRPLRSLLLLFDGSHPSNRALKLAADLSHHERLHMRVFTAGDSMGKAGEIQREAREYLGAFDLRVDFHVQAGQATMLALEDVEEEPVDLVVMGMQGHSALHRLILGSTAEQLMREVALPVLLVP